MSNAANKNSLSSTSVAILASLGIHGLLWVVLPGLTLDSQADKSVSQRTIGLVELSPQEQSRLPQVSNPVDNNLPSFASQLTELPPLPPAPPYQTSVMPPLQLPPGSAPVYNSIPNQNSAPPQTFQVPLPPPPTTSFPPIPYENLPNSPNNYPLAAVPQASPFVLPPNTGLPDTPLNADRTLPPEDNIATATPSPQPALPPQTNPDTPNPLETTNKLPERGKKELLAMRDRMRNNLSSRAITPPTAPRSPQELVAALKRNPSPPSSRSMSRQELVTSLKGNNRNPSNELSEETKTALDNLEKFKQQQAQLQAQNPDAITKPPIRRKITTCDRAIDGGIAVVGVVVNPEGKRLSEPNLITKTGKPDITQAQNYVRTYEFTKTGKTTNYNFRLEFDYSASKCAVVKPTPTPTSTTEPITIVTPKPTPTPASTPEPSSSPASTPNPGSIDPTKPSF